MEVLIFIAVYILIGCIIDLLITRGKQLPNFILAMIWPFFLLISVVLIIGEMREEKTANDAE